MQTKKQIMQTRFNVICDIINKKRLYMLIFLEDLGTYETGRTKKIKRRFFKVKCSVCNSEFKIMAQTFKKGKVMNCRSCGSSKHKQTNTRLYNIWTSMKQRCFNKKTNNYQKYGDRGIKVCDEWLEFEDFYKWSMLNEYEDNLTIDRKNNDLGYCPDNCRWTNHFIQQSNKIRLSAKNTSGYRGVTSRGKKCNYRVFVTNKNTTIYLGSYKTALEGAIVRDKYIIEKNLPHTLNGVL